MEPLRRLIKRRYGIANWFRAISIQRCLDQVRKCCQGCIIVK